MTEAEWLACEDPLTMLSFIRGKASERKLRLFALACCQRLTPMIPVGRERWFTGALMTAAQLVEGNREEAGLFAPSFLAMRNPSPEEVIRSVGDSDAWEGARRASQLTAELLGWLSGEEWRIRAERVLLSRRLRDIIGRPFRQVMFAPEWHTDTAVAISRGIYESQNFSAMPILADALQDAGCDCEDILNHCRDTNQVHVRGCWVCDLVLGKS